MYTIGKFPYRPIEENEIEEANEKLEPTTSTLHFLSPLEFVEVRRQTYIAELGIVDDDLVIHFYGTLPPQTDEILQKIFDCKVFDLTRFTHDRLLEMSEKARAGEKVSSTFIADVHREAKDHPAKIKKAFVQIMKSWTYTIKDGTNPFIDVLAKKLIDELDQAIAERRPQPALRSTS